MPNSLRDIFKYYIWTQTTSAVCPAISLNSYARVKCVCVSLSLYLRLGDVSVFPRNRLYKKRVNFLYIIRTDREYGWQTLDRTRCCNILCASLWSDIVTRKRDFIFQIYFVTNRITRRCFEVVEIHRMPTTSNDRATIFLNFIQTIAAGWPRLFRIMEFDYTRLTCRNGEDYRLFLFAGQKKYYVFPSEYDAGSVADNACFAR